MAKHYIQTTVTFWYESDNDEFSSEADAEAFGWDYDKMNYDGVYSIEVEELPNDDEEDEE